MLATVGTRSTAKAIGSPGRRGRRIFRDALLSVALLGGLGALMSADASAATRPDPSDPALLDRIDTFLRAEMRDADIPGLAVAIVAGGTVVHARGYGIADEAGRQVTADTPFQLASMSKAFTAAAIMQLVEDGAVKLDAPVVRYLPWFQVGTAQQSARITIRHLLNHTSGIPAHADEVGQSDGDDTGALERRVRSISHVVLQTEPGEHHEYGNLNYEILGLVVQTVAGMPFDDYVSRHIYVPLGMIHSHGLAADAFADGASEGFYRWFGVRTAPYRTPYPRAVGPAGVSFSSANDMARWALFQLGDLPATGVLEPESLAQLHTSAVQYDERHGYGMGWVIRPLWEELDEPPETGPITEPVPDLVEHGGAWETAHTYIGLVPERDWGVVVLANINDRTMSTRYYYIELGLLNMLSGHDPLEPRLFEPPLILYGKQLVVGLLVLQLIALVWTVRIVSRARSRRGSPSGPMLAGVGLAIAVDVIVVYLFLVVAPDWFGTSIGRIIRVSPDIGLLIPVMIVLALIWAPIRTAVMLLRDRLPTRTPVGT